MTDLLQKLDEAAYSQPLPIFNGSSIGQHFRHIVDFYGCLVRGASEGRIDYARRERDTRIETEPAYASTVLLNILSKTIQLSEDKAILIIADFSSELNEERPVVQSSIGRELMYAYDHAVHHLAMIKMGLKAAHPTIEVNAAIGVAPSTLKHWKQGG